MCLVQSAWRKLRSTLPVVVLAALCVVLYYVPGVKVDSAPQPHGVKARVVAVDDTALTKLDLLDYGTQRLQVELAGKRYSALNELRAQPELDCYYRVGDCVSVTTPTNDATPLTAKAFWRVNWSLTLFGAFCTLVICFGGWVGVKALLSFAFSCLVIWRVLIPLTLAGWDAMYLAFAVTVLLTVVIMFLVAGATRKCWVATVGAGGGVLMGLALAKMFARLMHVDGATMPCALLLKYSGYEALNLSEVFVGAVMLASSGAVMDLAMDIASGVEEVARHSPGLGFRALLGSGLRIGRSVVGTMTTTLLLAYSGGFLTLMMMFAAQGTPVVDVLNSQLVAAEVAKTLLGSFALVLVAPLTAWVAAWAWGNAPHY